MKMEITNMFRRPDDGMVVDVRFKITKTDGQHSAEYTGAVMLSPSFDNSKFIPFNLLHPDVVQDWVKSAIGDELEIIDGLLQKRINDQKSPSVVSGLPWE